MLVEDKCEWTFPLCPLAPDYKLDWNKIYSSFEWIREMEGTQQNTLYHAEGDVLTHTRLVCEALINMSEWKQLDNIERSILFLAALFHDVAKPCCTKIDVNGIISPGHAVKGELISRSIMYKGIDFKIPFRIREMIVKLVRYHGLPLFFLDKPNPVKAVIEASQMVRMDWLAMLAKADALGRDCSDKSELIDRTVLFNEFCKEQSCFSSPRSFPNSFSRFEYFQKENGFVDYEAYDDTKFEAIVMCALPAAGKDTWVEKNCKHLPVISLDDIREAMDVLPTDAQGEVIYQARNRAKEYLRAKKSFVWNATNITYSLRRQLISLFTDYGAKVKVVYLEQPYKEILRRNRERSRKVPENVIDRMIKKLEVPSVTEAHEVIWIVDTF